MPAPRGQVVSTHCFVDSDHASNTVTRCSQTGLLLFVNRAPVTWFSKRQNTVETSTFGSEFITMKTAVEHIEALCYKLRMFGIPIEGPTNVFCDNEAVFKNTSIPDSTLKTTKQFSRTPQFRTLMLSLGQGSGCCMHDASGQGRYCNQLGRPLHEAIDGFEKGVFIGQVYILMGVGFYPTSRFPTSSHHGSHWIGAGRQVKVSWLVQHGISLRGPKEI